MTNEKLKEIKRLAATWLGKEKDFYATGRDAAMHQFLIAMREHALPLVETLEEAWKERDEAREDERLAECRLDEIVELAGSGGDGSAFGSVESLLCDLKERTEERDEARAEVERLRDVVRKVHALVITVRATAVLDDIEKLRKIHKITKGVVE